MVALDYKDPEHFKLFHTWQNDPRVAAGWNETGDVDHHTKYLKGLHEDPHVFTMLAYFEDTPFAYFEVYWGKVRLHLLSPLMNLKLMCFHDVGRSPRRALRRG